MSINTYDQGDLVRCAGAFTDSVPAAIDPTTVTFKFQDPSGNQTTYIYATDAELIKDSTGNYHVDLDADEAGVWYYRFESGTEQAAAESRFFVKDSVF